MASELATTAAQTSLKTLEDQFATFPDYEQKEIQMLRARFRYFNEAFPASAALAMMATSFEIAIQRGE